MTYLCFSIFWIFLRLAGAIQKQETPVEVLERQGLLPDLHVRGLRLKSVHLVHRSSSEKDSPWKLSSTEVTKSFHSRRLQKDALLKEKKRKLKAVTASGVAQDDLKKAVSIAEASFAWRTQREQVLTVTSLIVQTLPAVFYNATRRYKEYGALLFNASTSAYAKQCNKSANVTQNCTTAQGQSLSELEQELFTEYRKNIKAAHAAKTPKTLFYGKRGDKCKSKAEDGHSELDRCIGDVGITMSVYEDDSSDVLVFHGGFGEANRDELAWTHKAWIQQKFQHSLIRQWSIVSHEHLTANASQRGIFNDSTSLLCRMNDTEFEPLPNFKTWAADINFSPDLLEKQGTWPLVKSIVRQVLPEGRTPSRKSIFLTGTGLGGQYAGMVSMWLNFIDNTKYTAFLIASSGYQCFARKLYDDGVRDFEPKKVNDQIKVYLHPFDAMAGSIDVHYGTLCWYGLRRIKELSKMHEVCSRMVGHTGPEFFQRKNTAPFACKDENGKTTVEKQEAQNYTDSINVAQASFDACHYFTHSPWFALMLLQDVNVLHHAGTTDGGCNTVPLVDAQNTWEVCPNVGWVEGSEGACEAFCLVPVETDMGAMVLIASIVGGVALFCGLTALSTVAKLENTDLETLVAPNYDARGKEKPTCYKRCLNCVFDCIGLENSDEHDRARLARLRAKEARFKKAENARVAEDRLERRKRAEAEAAELAEQGLKADDPSSSLLANREPQLEMVDGTVCPRCGNVYLPDAIFCRNCGKKRILATNPEAEVAAPNLSVDPDIIGLSHEHQYDESPKQKDSSGAQNAETTAPLIPKDSDDAEDVTAELTHLTAEEATVHPTGEDAPAHELDEEQSVYPTPHGTSGSNDEPLADDLLADNFSVPSSTGLQTEEAASGGVEKNSVDLATEDVKPVPSPENLAGAEPSVEQVESPEKRQVHVDLAEASVVPDSLPENLAGAEPGVEQVASSEQGTVHVELAETARQSDAGQKYSGGEARMLQTQNDSS